MNKNFYSFMAAISCKSWASLCNLILRNIPGFKRLAAACPELFSQKEGVHKPMAQDRMVFQEFPNLCVFWADPGPSFFKNLSLHS